MNGRPAKGRKPTKKEATIKEKLLRRIKEYEFNWLQIPFAIFFISLIWIVTYTPKESAPTPKNTLKSTLLVWQLAKSDIV